ncbi:MAG TPA: cytochrome c biogenesis protein CcdA [Thermoanaerobaculia bacterium]
MKRAAGFLAGLCLAAFAAAAAPKPNEILTVEAHVVPASSTAGTLRIDARIAATFHVNSHTPSEDYLIPTSVSLTLPAGVSAGEPRYPAGAMKKFSFSEKPLSVYEGRFSIDVPLTWGGQGAVTVAGKLDFQACNDTQCYAPASIAFRAEPAGAPAPGGAVLLSAAPPAAATGAGAAKAGAAAGASLDFEQQLNRRGLPVVLAPLFVGGLALNLTPCVYPVIPLTLSFFAGQAQGQNRRVFRLALVYVLGMATTYSALGVAAALSGRLFGSALQSPWVLGGVAVVLVALALSMFGLYDLRMPSFLMQKAGARSGMAGAYAMGLLVGVVAAPCVGPFVLGLLAFVAARQQAGLGFLFFFVLSLGLGLPYLFLGAFSGSLARLPRAGMWMESVKKIFGWVLLAMAAYFLRPALPGRAGDWLLTGILAAAAVVLIVRAGGLRPVVRFPAAVLFLGAAALFFPRTTGASGPAWEPYPMSASGSAAAGRPAVIEFGAAWCVPCRELDEKTFSDARVRQALAQRRLFKADLTKTGSAEVAELSDRFAILGVPTIVFLDASGKERSDLRLVGFEGPDAFLARLAKAP